MLIPFTFTPYSYAIGNMTINSLLFIFVTFILILAGAFE